MRGYIHRTDEGELHFFYATQGSLCYLKDVAAPGLQRAIDRAAGSVAPGATYRVQVSAARLDRYGYAFSVRIGRAVDPEREADRLVERGAKQRTTATTGAPGITGYQKAAEAATARLRNLRWETFSLAGALSDLCDIPD